MSSREVKKVEMTAMSTSKESENEHGHALNEGNSEKKGVVTDNIDSNDKLNVSIILPSKENTICENAELKQFHQEIVNEIDLFQSKIDSMRELRDTYDENDLVFAIHENFGSWLESKKEMYEHKIKDPSAGIVLYVKYIIESLIDNKLTEKEIKAYVVDACKDSFIKSTSRGTIAGLNLEVNTVCGALAALGIIQQDSGTFSIYNERLELSQFRNINSNISNEETKNTRLKIDEFILKELELIPEGVGKVFLQSISDRWSHAIPSYIDYSRKALLRQMQRDAAKAAAAEEAAKALALSLANEAVATKVDDLTGDVASSDDVNASTGVDVLDVSAHDTSLQTDAQADIHEMEVEPSEGVSRENEQVLESSDEKKETIAMDTDAVVADDGGVAMSVDATATVDPPNSRKRTANQRAWTLSEKFISSELLAPDRVLAKWSNLAYEEQKLLEIEESLLRRLAAQCNIPLLKTAYRSGTSYLSNSYVYDESNDVSEGNQDVSSSRPLLEQVELTGSMLVDRLYKTKNKSKRPKSSHNGSYSVSNGYYNSSNIPAYLSDLNSNNFTRNPAGNVRACDLRDDYAVLKPNMYLDPPLYAPYPYTINKNQLAQATIIIPDLVVKTSEIPWEMMAEEFVPLTVEETNDDVRVTHNGFTSTQSSPRGSSSDLRRNSSNTFSEKTPRSSHDSKDKKRLSFNFENQQISRASSAGSISSSIIGSNEKQEVLAPLFQEIVPVTSSAFVITSDGESDEEITKDLSDSAVAAKHEEKLKYMKQRWELLQSLKRSNSHNFTMNHIDSAVQGSSKKKKNKSTYYSKKRLNGVDSISAELSVAANGSTDSINEEAKIGENGLDSSCEVVAVSEVVAMSE